MQNDSTLKSTGRRRRRWLVIGLSGATGGGKTTLANRLIPSLPTSVYLNQDEYFLSRHTQGHLKAPESVGGINKDSLCSLDMTKMMRDIRQIVATDAATLDLADCTDMFTWNRVIGSALKDPRPPFKGRREEGMSHLPPVLLLDGFLLFNHAEVAAACDLRYFITLTKDQCWERRKNREFTSGLMKSKEYFDICAWPKYEEHFAQMSDSVSGIHLIDGAASSDLIYERVFKEVMNTLETWSQHE